MRMKASLGRYLCPGLICLVFSIFSGCIESEKTQFLTQGEQHLQSGDYEQAKSDYMKVLQVAPYDAAAAARLGQIWLEEGDPWRAGVFLKKTVELAPEDSASRLRLAKVYQAIGAENKAREEILKVLQKPGAKGEALVTLTELAHTPQEIAAATRMLGDISHKETASYQLAQANLALRRKDFIAAESAVKKAISLAPTSPEAHQALGFLKLIENDGGGAAEAFRIANDLAPPRSPIKISYAAFLKEIAGTQAATTYLKSVTGKAPDFFSAWIALARIALEEKSYDETSGYISNVLSRDPQNLEAQEVQSDLWLAQDQPERAILLLRDLEKSHPDLPEINYRLGKAYLQQKKFTEAAEALQQALSRNPDLIEAILTRAKLDLETGRSDLAVNALQELLKKHPNLTPARELLEEAQRAGRPESAPSP